MHKLHTIVGWVGTSMIGVILAFLPGYLNNPTPTPLKVMIGCGTGAVICFVVWLATPDKKPLGETVQTTQGANSPIGGSGDHSMTTGGDIGGNRIGGNNSGIQSQGPMVLGDSAIEKLFPKPAPIASAPTRKLPILELKFSQGSIELHDAMVQFGQAGGKQCYFINVHNMPAAQGGEDAFRADSISARLTFDHVGDKTSFANRACWVGKVENEIYLHPGDTEHVLLGIAEKEWWITYANPNKHASGGWPLVDKDLKEIRFPLFSGREVPGEITIISNQVNKATTLAVRRFIITVTNDSFFVNIRWLT